MFLGVWALGVDVFLNDNTAFQWSYDISLGDSIVLRFRDLLAERWLS